MDARFQVESNEEISFSDEQMSLVSKENHSELEDSDSSDYLSANEEEAENTKSIEKSVLDYSDLNSSALDPSKTGVVYLSSIPPFMKPTKLRHLLAQYGEIGRIYLTPEDSRTAMRRKKYKGNKRQNFTEGWVEFHSKQLARKLADTLNAQPIGGKKRAYYHDDIWALKYLPRFKWSNLTEQIAYERAVKEQRLRTEMSQAKKNTKEYVKNVEKGKMIEAMQIRKAAKNKQEGKEEVVDSKVQRIIRQRKSVVHEAKKNVEYSTLSRIFS